MARKKELPPMVFNNEQVWLGRTLEEAIDAHNDYCMQYGEIGFTDWLKAKAPDKTVPRFLKIEWYRRHLISIHTDAHGFTLKYDGEPVYAVDADRNFNRLNRATAGLTFWRDLAEKEKNRIVRGDFPDVETQVRVEAIDRTFV